MEALNGSARHPLAAFRPGLLSYRYDESLAAFGHNFERDLHMFVLWQNAQPQWPEILEDLERRFIVLDVRYIEWPADEVDDNFLRLYGSAPQRGRGTHFKRKEIVGGGQFAVVTIEDPAPRYDYDRTFSKKVELVNRAVVEAKARYREMTGGGFRVHSSNSLGEFFRDMSLLVGAPLLDELIARERRQGDAALTVRTSLAGAGGWDSLESLFRHLLRSTECLVLRNFDSLPAALGEGDADVDALCRSPHDVAALANADVRADGNGKFACETRVAGAPLALDLRFVGDGYYDAAWQNDMLARAQVQGGCVLVPAIDDHFFSLLYHAKLHKRAVKRAYGPRLAALAEQLGLPAYRDADLTNDEVACGMLAGFLTTRRYRPTVPLDIWVDYHAAFAQQLHGEGLLWASERERDTLGVGAVLARMPLLWRWRGRLTPLVTNAWRAARKLIWRGAR